MTDANNQINEVLSKLTALGTILIPMNLITGKYQLFPTRLGGGKKNLPRFELAKADERSFFF
jgi:magnesium transporter